MIMEINDGQFEFEFSSLTFVWCRRPGIGFTVYFEKIPPLLVKFGEAGTIINRIKFYDKSWNNVKKYLTVYFQVIIRSISENMSKNSEIHMRALRSESPSLSSERICSRPMCHHNIDYILVMARLLEIVDEETAENIWNSDIVEIYCCWCFVNHFKK